MKNVKSKVLKLQARQLLNGNYSFFALTVLLLSVSNMLLGYLLAFITPAVAGIFGFLLYLTGLLIVNTLYNILLSGIFRLYISLAGHKPYRLGDIFAAFTEHPEPIAVYSAFATLLETGYLYILAHGFRELSLPVLLGMTIGGIVLLWFLLTFQATLFLHACDPWVPAKEMLLSSQAMMKKHRLSLLRLQLSFLGILLLGVLSFGIGMFFAIPYLNMSITLFYLRLCDGQAHTGQESKASGDSL